MVVGRARERKRELIDVPYLLSAKVVGCVMVVVAVAERFGNFLSSCGKALAKVPVGLTNDVVFMVVAYL